MKSALLFSGGIDSLAIAWWKRPDIAITVDYGQLPAAAEIAASTAASKRLKMEHYVVRVDCRSLGSGDLAGLGANKNATASDWWPYRNQLLVTVAAMKAIGLDVKRLLIGTVRSDGNHGDSTPKFIAAMSALLRLQEGGLVVEAPAIGYSSAELVRLAGVPAGALAWAHSCHTSDVPCGACRGCNKYFEVLRELDRELDQAR